MIKSLLRTHYSRPAVAVLGLILALPASAENLPAGVRIDQSPAGRIFVTTDKRSLYWNKDDVAAKAPTCYASCLVKWRPLSAPADASAPAGWSVVARTDGGQQWAYGDKPLYTFVNDTFAGAQLGAAGRWNLLFEPVELPAGLTLQASLLGRVLADYKGRTLYTRASKRDGGGALESDDVWQPLTAPSLATVSGDWSLQPLPDGTRQWAYLGKRLYLFEKDRDPQDVRGHGVDGIWSAVILEPSPGLPPWVTIQRVDLGWVFADQRRMTVYYSADPEAMKTAQTCPQECMDKYWRPVLAEPLDVPVGRWTIAETADGHRQWAFAGQPLFTHTRDTKPGEMTGNSFAVGYSIGDGFRVILIEANLPPGT